MHYLGNKCVNKLVLRYVNPELPLKLYSVLEAGIGLLYKDMPLVSQGPSKRNGMNQHSLAPFRQDVARNTFFRPQVVPNILLANITSLGFPHKIKMSTKLHLINQFSVPYD